jgi:hypothetical protein
LTGCDFCPSKEESELRNQYWILHGILHPEQLGRLAASLLADDPDIKPHHFGHVMSTGKLLSLNVYFQIEMEN